ncbi:vWA domain-containing protein [Microbacterium sp.]|uniref:vWA domain-containing protein n=1 Tax=Microbacterium sp. TaxID=51671 RepID=UPI003F9A7397
MIFQPVLNVFLLILLFAPVAALAVWMLVRGQRALWSMRLVMLLAIFVMLLRPGIPGGATQTLATDTDIVIVLDTTASMVAEDWDGDLPRLDGVRADVQSIVDEYPGARFALITFAAAAEQRLPLTTDTTALMSSLEILRPEVTSQSRGSSIGIANTMLQETLAGAAESAPDRSRMVFYLGDGEQTVTTEPESFSASAEFVDGGGVLGYGTSAGGPMKITSGNFDGDEGGYIEYQGEPAMSVIDDTNLQAIAGELDVPFQLRDAEAALDLPEAPATTTNYAESGEVGNVTELYWVFALLIVLLLGVELARATMLVAQLRGLATPREGSPHGSLSEGRLRLPSVAQPVSSSRPPAAPLNDPPRHGGDA